MKVPNYPILSYHKNKNIKNQKLLDNFYLQKQYSILFHYSDSSLQVLLKN